MTKKRGHMDGLAGQLATDIADMAKTVGLTPEVAQIALAVMLAAGTQASHQTYVWPAVVFGDLGDREDLLVVACTCGERRTHGDTETASAERTRHAITHASWQQYAIILESIGSQ